MTCMSSYGAGATWYSNLLTSETTISEPCRCCGAHKGWSLLADVVELTKDGACDSFDIRVWLENTRLSLAFAFLALASSQEKKLVKYGFKY
jgi:hypothetical protein